MTPSALWGDLEFDSVTEFATAVEAPAPPPPEPAPAEVEPDEQPDDIVEQRTLADGRLISIDRKGRWYDAAGRRLRPIVGARAFRLGENDGIVCPDCSSPIRWKCGSWGCPSAPGSRRFCGGLAVPVKRRARDKIKWSCGSCAHTWKTPKDDEHPTNCPKCDYRGVHFEKRVSR